MGDIDLAVEHSASAFVDDQRVKGLIQDTIAPKASATKDQVVVELSLDQRRRRLSSQGNSGNVRASFSVTTAYAVAAAALGGAAALQTELQAALALQGISEYGAVDVMALLVGARADVAATALPACASAASSGISPSSTLSTSSEAQASAAACTVSGTMELVVGHDTTTFANDARVQTVIREAISSVANVTEDKVSFTLITELRRRRLAAQGADASVRVLYTIAVGGEAEGQAASSALTSANPATVQLELQAKLASAGVTEYGPLQVAEIAVSVSAAVASNSEVASEVLAGVDGGGDGKQAGFGLLVGLVVLACLVLGCLVSSALVWGGYLSLPFASSKAAGQRKPPSNVATGNGLQRVRPPWRRRDVHSSKYGAEAGNRVESRSEHLRRSTSLMGGRRMAGAGRDAAVLKDPRLEGRAGFVRVVAFQFDAEGPLDEIFRAGFCRSSYPVPGGLEIEAQARAAGMREREASTRRSFTNAEAALQALALWHEADSFTGLTAEEALRLRHDLAGQEDHEYGGLGSSWQSMWAVLRAKFKAGSPLASKLLSTRDSFLLAHRHAAGRGKAWSDNSDGQGTNQLGMQLMLLRDQLSGESEWTVFINGLVDPTSGDAFDEHSEGMWQLVVKSARDAAMDACSLSTRREKRLTLGHPCASTCCNKPVRDDSDDGYCSWACLYSAVMSPEADSDVCM